MSTENPARPDFSPPSGRVAAAELSVFVEAIGAAVLVLTLEGEVCAANEPALELLHLSDTAPRGTLADYVPRFNLQAVRLVPPGEVSPPLVNRPMVRADGEPFEGELYLRSIRVHESPYWVATLYDVSARVRREREVAKAYENLRSAQARVVHSGKLAAIGQLAGGVAHEVNNPATFILTNLEVMREQLGVLRRQFRSGSGAAPIELHPSQDDSRALLREFAEMLDDNVTGIKRIASIARDLQMFSRADRDDLQAVDVNEIVDVACNLAYNDIRHRARLVKELGRIPSILGEPGKLAQALTNLLANAAQAIDVGAADEHEVRVSTRLTDGEVRIVVSDTGRGIPGDLHAQIFEPFFTTKPSEGGTGLGLSLCAEIVRKHGGDIQVRSVPDRGTRFEIKLPFRPAEQPAIAPTVYPQTNALPRARVLIIDDDVAVLRAQRRLLSGDHDVSTAGSGAEALARMAEEGPFDVILCDVMMPTMDGPMFYDAVRLQDPAAAETILFCSGGVFTERAKAFIAAVPNAFLAKPISREALQRALRKVFRRRQNGALEVIG